MVEDFFLIPFTQIIPPGSVLCVASPMDLTVLLAAIAEPKDLDFIEPENG